MMDAAAPQPDPASQPDPTPPPDPDPAPASRRPLGSRNTGWARKLAATAVDKGLTPNQISQASIGIAALGCFLYMLTPASPGFLQVVWLLLVAATIQTRLICNLIDGMVAVEGGQGAKDGPFWNEAPDRLSDLFLLIGAGIAAQNVALGTLAASLAIATAYLRELGRAEGFPADFSGPMAKPQRMAVLTAGTVIAAFYASEWTLNWTLWIIVAGTTLTILSRSMRLIKALKAK